MEISELTVKVLILFFPGIIALIIVQKLIFYQNKSLFYFVVHSFVLGVMSYFIYYVYLMVKNYLNKSSDVLFFIKSITETGINIEFREVFCVTCISIVVGFAVSFAINKKWVTNIGTFFKVTKQFSEPDVWSYVFNSIDKIEWVVVRDANKNLYYEGWVGAFSDTYRENELFMRDVVVGNNKTGEEYYKLPGLYISRDEKDITIEFSALDFSGDNAFERPDGYPTKDEV